MTPARSARQQSIVDWFDKTYHDRGNRYLRPVNAYYIFLELLNAQPGQKILDIACGLGRLLEAAQRYDLNLTGIDISKVAVDAARENVPQARIEVANAEALPFADNSYDLLTCIGSIERMLDLQEVLSEMRRVGRRDARYCLFVRNSATLSWRLRKIFARRNEQNANAETLEVWTRLFTTAGFDVKSIWPDQYPLHRRIRWLSLGLRRADFKRPVQGSLAHANEFLFLLEKSV